MNQLKYLGWFIHNSMGRQGISGEVTDGL